MLDQLGRYRKFLKALGHDKSEVGSVYAAVRFCDSVANLRLLPTGVVELAMLTGEQKALDILVTEAAKQNLQVFSPALNRVFTPDDRSATDSPNPS